MGKVRKRGVCVYVCVMTVECESENVCLGEG